MYKYIGKTESNNIGTNKFCFTENKTYKRVKDRIYSGYENTGLCQCIIDNKGQYVMMMKTSPLEKRFIISNHIFNRFYKLKKIFLW